MESTLPTESGWAGSMWQSVMQWFVGGNGHDATQCERNGNLSVSTQEQDSTVAVAGTGSLSMPSQNQASVCAQAPVRELAPPVQLQRTVSVPVPSAAPPPLRRAQTAIVSSSGRSRPVRSSSTSGRGGKTSTSLVDDLQPTEERGSSVPPPHRCDVVSDEDTKYSLVASALLADAPTSPSPFRRAVSREVCEKVHATIKPGIKAINRDSRRQLRIVVGGLQGSGKSTLCRILVDLLDGIWINQDEFAHKGKKAKNAFLAEITKISKDRKVPVLIVDKVNTMRQHRQGIVDAMCGGVSGDIVFVQVGHPLDDPGSLKYQLQLCLERIRARGSGHRTLMGDDPELQSILSLTAGGVEPMDDAELAQFVGRFMVDMTLQPIVAAKQLIIDFVAEELLGRFQVEALLTKERLEKALAATHSAEAQLAGAIKDSASAGSASGKKSKSKSKAKKPRPVMWWEIKLEGKTSEAIIKLWQEHAKMAPENLNVNKSFHITLFYLGGRSNEHIATKHPHVGGPQDVAKWCEHLEALEDTEVNFEIVSVVWDERIAAAEVSGLPEGLCANIIAHITLAYKATVAPSLSNELLARQAVRANFNGHLLHWLAALDIAPHYGQIAADWCAQREVGSPEELAENAAALAAVLEPNSEEQQAVLKSAIAKSTPGTLHERTLEEPLRLSGNVHGRRSGD